MTELRTEILMDGVKLAFADNEYVTLVPEYRVQRLEYNMDVNAADISPADVPMLVEELEKAANFVEAIDDMNFLVEKAEEAVSKSEREFLVNAIARCIAAEKYDAIIALLDF